MSQPSTHPGFVPIVGLSLLLVAAAAFAGDAEGAQDRAYLDAMSREHAGETPLASGAAKAAPAMEVEGRRVAYATQDGKPVEGYLAEPKGAGKGLPGILVIHEWWGLNDNIEAMARRLAGEGYAALAVDLYGGKSAQDAGGARALVQKTMENPDAAKDNLRQAYEYLDKQMGAPKIGVIGWCFGGGWSLQTALLFPHRIDATVIYYGRLTDDKDELSTLQMPVIGFFGAEDQGITPDSVHAFEAAMKYLHKDVEVHIYDGAGHAFANPSGERYRPEAAQDAWKRTVAFFAAHLKG